MINVTIYQNSHNVIERCIMEGHAEYGEVGSDIVCAAASMLMINTYNSIEKFTEDRAFIDVNRDNNRYDMKFVNEPGHDARLLMDAFAFGLQSISDQYGEQFLKITLKEVQ